jgi:WhiB family transcriptional regulator, redox-sensing transcriptional regulator
MDKPTDTSQVDMQRARRSRRGGRRQRRNLSLGAAANDGSAEARRRLVEENVGLVHYVVGTLDISPAEREDAVGAGMLGLVRAVADYDPQRSSFSTYAVLWIRHGVYRHLRNRGRDVNVELDTLDTLDTLSGGGERQGEPEAATDVWSFAQQLTQAAAALDEGERSALGTFVEHLGDERRCAQTHQISVGAWRRRMDVVWSKLRHPAGPSLGNAPADSESGRNRWRIIPPAGAFTEQAACAGLGLERFFPERGGRVAAAVEVCERCPARDECRAFAISNPSVAGVWGGTGEQERRWLRRDDEIGTVAQMELHR